MHQYLFICMIYWKNKQQCNQLQYKQQCPISLNMKNHSAEQKSYDKKGSRAKNRAVKNCSKFAMKNAPCVNRTIEIALEQIQCNIAVNLQCQNCSKFTLCVSRHLSDNNHTERREQEITGMNINTYAISTLVIIPMCTSIEDIQEATQEDLNL